MNRYVVRTSLFWSLLFAVVVVVYLSRSQRHSHRPEEGVQPLASGPSTNRTTESTSDTRRDLSLSPVQLTDEQQQSIGITTGTVEYKDLNDSVRATGTVDIDERMKSYVQVRFSGYIRRVFANATYQYVHKGDPLFTIYSPELVATQEEYLNAQRNAATWRGSSVDGIASGAASLVSAAEQRLRQWEIPAGEIAKMKQSGKARADLAIDSPTSGYILERNALPDMYVEPATKLYTLAELSRVWVNAQVFQTDVGRIKRGDHSEITIDAYPGRTFKARIEEILPDVDLTTRTVKVRLAVNNPGITLKPGMFVNVDLKSSLGPQLTVPAAAIFRTGKRQIVFIDRGNGSFEPKNIQAGPQVGDDVVVLKGLDAHDRIVTSANFLLDSESQLHSATAVPALTAPSASGIQPALAIDFAAVPNPPHKGSNAFRVILRGTNGQPIAGADVSVNFFMAAMPAMGMGAMNSTARLAPRVPGIYEGNATLESGGTWEVTVTVKQNGKVIATKQLSVNADGGM